ncbi:MAG: formimidoylglutamase [Flavobacteriaceae bacterium]|nr:formimidoylglutamase [Flavobacteriaceae bacterium]
MLNESYFSPVADTVLAHNALLSKQALGNQIKVHSIKEGFPEVDEEVRIVIFGVKENRNDIDYQNEDLSFSEIRTSLYSLYPGSWSSNIVYLGDIQCGNEVSDTYYAIKDVVSGLISNNMIPIIIGGSQDLTYPVYRAYDEVIPMVNILSIDRSFDFGNVNSEITNKSYLSKIVIEEPNNLFNYVNLGYQTYFNSQEEIDLIDKLYFDAIRLGEIASDLRGAEPYLRDANIVSLDLSAIKSQDLGIDKHSTPNGFSSVDACSLARYAGLSNNVSTFGVFEYSNIKKSKTTGMLIAQIIWYFIEGVNYRVKDFPDEKIPHQKFIVLVDDQEIIFYKSLKTNRWWVQLPNSASDNNKIEKLTLLSCKEADYKMACNQEIPENYFKALQKALI